MAIIDDYDNLFKYMNGDKNVPKIGCIMANLKRHMIHNPNEDVSLMLKDWLFSIFLEEFSNPELKNALDMDDSLVFTKKLEIYKAMPFVHNFSDFRYFFYGLIPTTKKYGGDPKNFYKSGEEFCGSYISGLIPKELFERVIEYCDNNRTIMTNAFEKYNVRSPKLGNHVKGHANPLGYIGEQYVYDSLKDKGQTTYLKNNGFGFDVLFVDQNNKEWLVEVKTTDRKVDTYFEISENEKRVLKEALEIPNAEYVIDRVFVGENREVKSHITLYYDKDNNAFYNNDDPSNPVVYYSTKEEPLKYTRNTHKLVLKNNNQ